uniref:Uncharacterized protein n=1 Tax=Tanacetum cinerariifolium TaxID=118510 RepID=A0A699ICT5_TANCI|nr:hypothetical protein [Tanacetum cinerariifolium]
MRHYQGPDMPILAHMLNQGEPAFVQAQQQEVSPPPPSPMVAPHPSPDPMPSPPRQSSPPSIPFGHVPSSGVVSSEGIPDIPSSSEPSEPVLENITSPIRGDDTGGGSFHESPPRPPPTTPTSSPTVGVAEEPLTLTSLLVLFLTCLQRIATLEAELKATKILHRDIVVLFARRIKKLESKLKTKKRKLVLSDSENEEEARQSQELEALLDLANAALHEPSHSTTLSKPANPEQSSEQEISPTTLDAVLTLSQSKARARAATIIYKCLKKQQSSSGLDFMDAAIPASGLDYAGRVDSAGRVVSTGRVDSAGELDSAGRVDSAVGRDSAGRVVSAGGVDSADRLISAGVSVATGPTVLAEPSSPIRDPSKGKAVATPSSPVKAPTAKELADQQAAILEAKRQELLDQELKQSLDAEQVYLDSLLAQRVAEEQKRESMASTTQSTQRQAELDRVALNLTNEEWIGLVDQVRANLTLSAELLGADVSEDTFSIRMETTSVSAGATIYVGDPIPTVTSVSAASSVPARTPIAAGVSTTSGASGSAKEQDVPLRKSSRKKSIARRRTLPSPSKSKSAALPFDEDDPKAKFKKADGTVKRFSTLKEHRFSTLKELMYWAGRAYMMVLYGMVSDKYKIKRATGIGLCLWSDLRTLITAMEDRDASIIWDDQDKWEIQSWRFYALLAIHVLETEAGDIIYMFMVKKVNTPWDVMRIAITMIEAVHIVIVAEVVPNFIKDSTTPSREDLKMIMVLLVPHSRSLCCC